MVEGNTSFSVDELTVKLRKSLTLEDQPVNEVSSALDQAAIETDLESDSAKFSSLENPADDTSTFFDCENKSFVLPDNVIDPTVDIANNHHSPPQSDVGVVEPHLVGETDDKPDTDSTEIVDKMADNLDQPASPPIAVTKGSYNINWDDFDENSDPFKPKKGLSNSPPRSPVLPACVGAGDSNYVAEVDPFKPSRRLTNSPPGAVSASERSAEKQTQRRSINNNLPEPVTDSIVSSSSDSISPTNATDNMSVVSENEVPSADDGKQQSDVAEVKSTTECADAVK